MSFQVGPRGLLPAPSPEFSIHLQYSRFSAVATIAFNHPTASIDWAVPSSALHSVFNLWQTLLVDSRMWVVVNCGVRCAIERAVGVNLSVGAGGFWSPTCRPRLCITQCPF